MGEQPFLGAGFVFLVVMTVALVRLGKGEGGRHWAAAWVTVWLAGLPALWRDTVPGMTPVLAAAGVVFSTLFVTGSIRFLGREVPRWVWATAGAVLVARLVLLPWMSMPVSEATGAALVWGATLTSSALLVGQRRPDGSRRNRRKPALAERIQEQGVGCGQRDFQGVVVEDAAAPIRTEHRPGELRSVFGGVSTS